MIIVIFILISISLILTLFRLIIGPDSADRIISVDTLNMKIVGVIALLSLYFNNNLFLDVAIVYAVLSFLETVVFARYMEG